MSAARALLPAKMRFTAVFFVLLLSATASGYYDYDYLSCARREIPDLVGEPSNGDHGFKITISGDNSDRMTSKSRNVPGGMYTIVLQSDKRSSKKFTEFMLYVEHKEIYTMHQSSSPDDGFLTSQTFNDLGKFQLYTDSLVKLADYCPNAVTQTTPVPKSEISVMWLAPSASFGCVIFKAVLIEHKDVWFHGNGGLSKIFCEEELDFKDKEENITECCACDEAKYEVTFEGLWSKYTHPKDFPPNVWQTHFSDIIGASHSSNFRIWNYGGYATEGVKQVAQSGITKKLEAELKTESNKIRTIIKARGLWFPNLNGKTFAVFRVDKKHHLMSILSRLSPSPDWVVGVSALELCLKNCTWVTEKSMDLYLWDAGTDSGITYLSPDSPTIPQERIRHITNKSPNLPESPFYDPTGIPTKPFARLTVARQRIYEKTDCNSTEDETINFDENDRYCRVTEWTVFGPCSVSCGEGMRKRTRNYIDEKAAKEAKCRVTLVEKEECGAKCINNVSCETTSWSEWQPCNVTCGRGYRTRSRKFMHRLARKMCTNVELVQKEPCMGAMPVCDGTSLPPRASCYGSPYCNSEVEIIDPNCTVTKWSEWSPCSKSCGKGLKIRTRFYINPYKSKRVCKVRLIQSIECETEPCISNRNDARTVCMLPREVGPCRGYFPRYYFDSGKGVCVQFIFSGCRGNHNNFERLLDCREKCENFAKVTTDSIKAAPQYSNYSLTPLINDQGPVINCSVTEWSEWSPCSRTCGTARKERRREIKLNAQNGGRPCPRRLVQRRKCKDNPPCDCELSEWSDWSECETSCNGNGLAIRSRNITRLPDPGRPPCGPTVDRRHCIEYARCDGT